MKRRSRPEGVLRMAPAGTPGLSHQDRHAAERAQRRADLLMIAAGVAFVGIVCGGFLWFL